MGQFSKFSKLTEEFDQTKNSWVACGTGYIHVYVSLAERSRL
jgi:hypothetical protein